jgi:hypothetical protein
MGLLHIDDLPLEIEENLYLNYRHAKALASDIITKVLAPLREEIEAIYRPIGTPSEKTWEEATSNEPLWGVEGESETKTRIISLEEIGGEAVAEKKIPIVEEKTAETSTTKEPKPLIISEGKPLLEELEKKQRPTIKSFLFPFKLFKREEKPFNTIQGKPVKVKVETPDRSEKIVHYGEPSTPIPTFGKEEDIISLETFEPIKIKTEEPKKQEGEEQKDKKTEIPPPPKETTPSVQPELPSVPTTAEVASTETEKPSPEKREIASIENPILREIAEKAELAAKKPEKEQAVAQEPKTAEQKTEEQKNEKQPFWKRMFIPSRVEELGKKEAPRINADQDTNQRGSQQSQKINADENADKRESGIESADKKQSTTNKRLWPFKFFGKKEKEPENDRKIITDDKTTAANEKKTEGAVLKGNVVDLRK